MSYVVCFQCGKPGHYANECYSRFSYGSKSSNPFKTVVCFKCGRPGHYANECDEDSEAGMETDEYSSDEGYESRGYSNAREYHPRQPTMNVSSSGKGYSIAYPDLPGLKPVQNHEGGVYVLRYPNGMIYVGKSNDVQGRVLQHKRGDFALLWGTPAVVPTETPAIPHDLESWERNETLHQMRKHGIQKVRGWKYTASTLTAEEHRDVSMQIREKYDLCRLCGSDKHFANACRLSK